MMHDAGMCAGPQANAPSADQGAGSADLGAPGAGAPSAMGEGSGSIGVTADVVIMTIRDGALRVLLVERPQAPFEGALALPGGFLGPDEDASAAALRVLREETGVDGAQVHIEQLATYTRPDRDPRMRVVSIAHLAFAPDLPDAGRADGALVARWWSLEDLIGETGASGLAFDHAQILHDGIERVRAKLEYTTLATRFVAEPFTIAELRSVYAAVWGTPPDRMGFTRRVLATDGFVVPDPEALAAAAAGPPRPMLYRRGEATHLHPALLRVDPA